ncbi:hypothetical protein BJ875DRAFT_440757 [Amylocarpus encephaloides]|uniref:Uncharacterized protein n=1 Tax=Amylocarpus encephaloides TaxID=45428 RepID=A0A9P7YK56_9HELO|nr:hypothetical protein BJ875DRAFT_440757 [Amylocarpus encephaloides]
MWRHLLSKAILLSLYASYSAVNALPQVSPPNLPSTPSSNPPPYPEIKPKIIAIALFGHGNVPNGKMSALDPNDKEPPFCEGMFQTFELPFTSLIKCRDGYELQYSFLGDMIEGTPKIKYQFTHFVPGQPEKRTVETGIINSRCAMNLLSSDRDCTWPACLDGSSDCETPIQKKSAISSLPQIASSNPAPFPEIKPRITAFAHFNYTGLASGIMAIFELGDNGKAICGDFLRFPTPNVLPLSSSILCRPGYEFQYSIQEIGERHSINLNYQLTHFDIGQPDKRTVELGTLNSRCGFNIQSSDHDCAWPSTLHPIGPIEMT